MPPLRPVTYGKLAAIFEKDGFVFDHQRGDHLICRVHSSLRVTPAMEAGITDHIRTIAELIA
jgi:predicted RNA binding protein YcfA (HicA-like mRNA interferase family)